MIYARVKQTHQLSSAGMIATGLPWLADIFLNYNHSSLKHFNLKVEVSIGSQCLSIHLTLLGSLPLAWFSTSLAVTSSCCSSGGRGISAGSTSGTSSNKNLGCQRVTLLLSTFIGGLKASRNL